MSASLDLETRHRDWLRQRFETRHRTRQTAFQERQARERKVAVEIQERAGRRSIPTFEPCPINGKRQFVRHQAAAKEAARLSKMKGEPLHHYQCVHCDRWHLTHHSPAVSKGIQKFVMVK